MKERAGGQSSCRQALQGTERSELDGTRLCYRERSREVLRVFEHRASKALLAQIQTRKRFDPLLNDESWTRSWIAVEDHKNNKNNINIKSDIHLPP